MVYFHFIHALIRITLINFALFYLFTPNVTYLKNVALTFSFRQLSERGKKKKKKVYREKKVKVLRRTEWQALSPGNLVCATRRVHFGSLHPQSGTTVTQTPASLLLIYRRAQSLSINRLPGMNRSRTNCSQKELHNDLPINFLIRAHTLRVAWGSSSPLPSLSLCLSHSLYLAIPSL